MPVGLSSVSVGLDLACQHHTSVVSLFVFTGVMGDPCEAMTEILRALHDASLPPVLVNGQGTPIAPTSMCCLLCCRARGCDTAGGSVSMLEVTVSPQQQQQQQLWVDEGVRKARDDVTRMSSFISSSVVYT